MTIWNSLLTSAPPTVNKPAILFTMSLIVFTIACTTTAKLSDNPELIRPTETVGHATETVGNMPNVSTFPRLKVTAPEGLNLRQLPNSSSDVILVLRYGDEVHDLGGRAVSADGLRWFQVEHERAFGWCWAEWLE